MKKYLLIGLLWLLSFTTKGQTFPYQSDSCYYYEDVNVPSYVTYSIHYDVTIIRTGDITVLHITSVKDTNNRYTIRIDSLLATRENMRSKLFLFKGFELNLKTIAVVSFMYRDGKL